MWIWVILIFISVFGALVVFQSRYNRKCRRNKHLKRLNSEMKTKRCNWRIASNGYRYRLEYRSAWNDGEWTVWRWPGEFETIESAERSLADIIEDAKRDLAPWHPVDQPATCVAESGSHGIS